MNLKLVTARILKPAPWLDVDVDCTQPAFEALKQSIVEDPDFLQERPILVMSDGTIYAGLLRYFALVSLYQEGWLSPWGANELIPVSVREISEVTARMRTIRDNAHIGRGHNE